MGRLLAVTRANYMVQVPICNAGDVNFPLALGTLRGVLSRECRPRWVERVAQGLAAPLQQEGPESDIWENFLPFYPTVRQACHMHGTNAAPTMGNQKPRLKDKT